MPRSEERPRWQLIDEDEGFKSYRKGKKKMSIVCNQENGKKVKDIIVFEIGKEIETTMVKRKEK